MSSRGSISAATILAVLMTPVLGAVSGIAPEATAVTRSATSAPKHVLHTTGPASDHSKTLIVACTTDAVEGIEPSTGNFVSTRTVPSTLSSNVFTTAPSCSAIDPTGTYFALSSGSLSNGSEHVGIYNDITGKITDITATTTSGGSNFGSKLADDSDPRFLGTTYFTFSRGSSTKFYNLRSRKLTSGTANDFPVVSPDASVQASYGAGVGLLLDGLEFNTIPTTPMRDDEANVVMGPLMPDLTDDNWVECMPKVWVTDSSLICGGESDLSLLTISTKTLVAACDSCVGNKDGYGSSYGAFWDITGTGPTPLLPSNSRTNSNPVPSPDGSQFAFLSTQGSQVGLYVDSIDHPGSSPKRLASVTDNFTLIGWISK
jgi:hypothetical protein